MSQEKPKRLTQYVIGLTVGSGGFILGNTIGWGSPCQQLVKDIINVQQDDDPKISFIISLSALAAASAMIYVALTVDKVGCRLTMVIITIPAVLGFLLLAFGDSVAHFLVGRFVTGFCGGCFCVTAPTYTGEIADKHVRGRLGLFFQISITLGIGFVYCLGLTKNIILISAPCAILPFILFFVFLFMPDTPVFLMKKGKLEKARKAMQFFRGKDFNIEPELKELEEYTKITDIKFCASFKQKATQKALWMLLGMHGIQKLTGINVISFYTEKLFVMAQVQLNPTVCAIIVGLFQLIFVLISGTMVDTCGRTFLWFLSLGVMFFTLLALGVYFVILHEISKETAAEISWLPLAAIYVYISAFNLGCGPLPWIMLGELIPNRVKGVIGAAASCLNWTVTFLVVQIFPWCIKTGPGQYIIFFFFAGVCLLGIAFIYGFVIETNHKSLQEIQEELNS